MVPIEKLVPYVNNARTHSPEQKIQLRSSLREFGFINPVIVDKDYGIIAGHGRVMAAKEEGLTEVPTAKTTQANISPLETADLKTRFKKASTRRFVCKRFTTSK